jgi:ATP/maltotriose-dependent transcriptional regulator MalT
MMRASMHALHSSTLCFEPVDGQALAFQNTEHDFLHREVLAALSDTLHDALQLLALLRSRLELQATQRSMPLEDLNSRPETHVHRPQWQDSHLPEPKRAVEATAQETLSERELTVLRLIAQGLSNQEIGEHLFISLHTVKTHARKINCKLGVARRTQAVAYAKAIGLLA